MNDPGVILRAGCKGSKHRELLAILVFKTEAFQWEA
jgi:hypothetical protein